MLSTYNVPDRLVRADSRKMCKTKPQGAPFTEVEMLEEGHLCVEGSIYKLSFPHSALFGPGYQVAESVLGVG